MSQANPQSHVVLDLASAHWCRNRTIHRKQSIRKRSAARSFCERINSCANQIVTAGNTSLGDNLVDKAVVLRMNKNFKKFMNLNYPWILK